MSNSLEVGSIVDGKVINVKPYGAFVAIGDNQKGLIHISHISGAFVKDINDFIRQGDNIKVKVLSVEEDKIALSLKDCGEVLPRHEEEQQKDQNSQEQGVHVTYKCLANLKDRQPEPVHIKTFDELMKDYNRQANDRQVDINKRLKNR